MNPLTFSSSHANVHSQDRPHFCPVEGCPRSIGGKGFKRKNEMMRHGLVHNSPGYVCPFCPDQQHRYPRPDNLQRFVSPSISNLTSANSPLTDMSVYTMLTKVKTTPYSDKSSPSVLREALVDVNEEWILSNSLSRSLLPSLPRACHVPD